MPAFMFSRLQTIVFASLTLASSALAGVYITNPVANSIVKPGELLTIRWVDDGTTPHLATIGSSQIALYTGSATQQTFLQELAASIDVTTSNSLDAWIDSNLGPSGNYYFIRITSNSLKDAAQPQYPYQSYSARFRLDDMSGSFNASVWQQLNSTPSASPPTASSRPGTFGGAAAQNATGSASAPTSSNSAVEGSAASSSGVLAAPTSATILGSGMTSGTPRNTASMTTIRSPSAPSVSPTLSSATTSSSSAAGTRLSVPFGFKAPQVLARSHQPGSPEGRTATLMVTSVLVGVFGFGLAIAL